MKAPRRRSSLWWLAPIVVATLTLLLAGWAYLRLGIPVGELAALLDERSPQDVLRYAERRLDGHTKLETAALPLLRWARARLEREPPAELADLGKGQHRGAQVPVSHDAQGRPVAASQALRMRSTTPPTRVLRTTEDIIAAARAAKAGDILEIAPGRYLVPRSIHTRAAGEPGRPIVLRAAEAGTVILESQTTEAMVVSQPYWVIENLDWQGRCRRDDGCEHAVHIVGRARGVVIVNNRMTDFNAHVKVNGDGGHWPDDGLLQFNTLNNTRPRRAARPVAPVDLVAASGWQLLDNRIEDFARTDTRRPSYGLFMKGGGRGGRIERNVVICTRQGVSQPGHRVGIGVGSGGTAGRFCRDGRCTHEHTDAIVANNVVAHCNDLGIDVANSARSQVLHNTVINTAGIGLRNPPADARAERNLLDGRFYARRGTALQQADNRSAHLPDLLSEADALQLAWRELPEPVHAVHPMVTTDFCGRQRPLANPPGATVGAPGC